MTHRSSIVAAAAAALPAVLGLQLLGSILPAEAAVPSNVTVTNTPDHATVNAGDAIGFTLTITNAGTGETTGTADGVTAAEPLPLGATGATGISWSIDQQTGSRCQVTATDGAQPGQELDCLAVSLAPGAGYRVHVTSPTTGGSCGSYTGTARVTVPTQSTSALTASATTAVACPADPVSVTADASPVSAGGGVGFTFSVSNAGSGAAGGVELSAPLPGGVGVQWAITPAYAGPGTCALAGAAGGQTLSCAFGTMGPGALAAVHVASGTSSATCVTLTTAATVTSANGPASHAGASISMVCASVLGASTVPVPATGAGGGGPVAALGLVAGGLALIGAVQVRRRRLRG